MKPVYIAGTGLTRFGKRHEPLIDLLEAAAREALDDDRDTGVDALYLGLMNPEGFVSDGNYGAWLADRLGLSGAPAVRVEATSSTGAAALHQAFYAVASGAVERALVVAGDAMTHLPTRKVTQLLSQVVADADRRAGATMPALAGLVTRRWMHEAADAQSCQDALMAVALKNHANGLHNPHAQFREAITPEQYASSRSIASPLRLFDCAPITDGAAALVLSTRPGDVRLWGVGQGTDTLSLCDRGQVASFRATRLAALRAYRMAERGPDAVTFAEIHDAFTPFELLTLEDAALFPPGSAVEATVDGDTAASGAFPVNASGGLKARGHPVSTSGLAQVVEATRQQRREVEPDVQVGRSGLALCQSTGGLFNQSFVTLLGRSNLKRAPLSPAQAAFLDAHPAPGAQRSSARTRTNQRAEVESLTFLTAPADGFPAPMLLALVRAVDGARLIARGDPDRAVEIGQTVYLKRVEASGWHGPYYFTEDPGRLRRGEVSVHMMARKGALEQVRDLLVGAHLRPRYFPVKKR